MEMRRRRTVAAANFNRKEGDKMTLTLNIYSATDKGTVEKTYTAESYDLMLGTVEDIMAIIDIDKMTDSEAMTRMVVQAFGKLKPFIKDVFPGVSDDELKRVKVKELIPTFVDIFKSILDDLKIIQSGN